jgi:hypothetical protein
MYGAFARYGGYALFGALFAAVASEIFTPMIGVLGPEADGTPYKVGIQAVESNVLLIILIGCVFGVVTRAIIERRATGGI